MYLRKLGYQCTIIIVYNINHSQISNICTYVPLLWGYSDKRLHDLIGKTMYYRRTGM